MRLGSPVSWSWVAMNTSSSSRRVSACAMRSRSCSNASHIRTSVTSSVRCVIDSAWASAVAETAIVGAISREDLSDRIAPVQAVLRHLVQRPRALGRQLAVGVPGLLPGLRASTFHPLARARSSSSCRCARSCREPRSPAPCPTRLRSPRRSRPFARAHPAPRARSASPRRRTSSFICSGAGPCSVGACIIPPGL